MDTGTEENDPPPRYEAATSDPTTNEFTGEVATNNALPTQADLDRVADLLVLDSKGQSRPFKDLYSGPNVAKRQLILFVRHFFCGNCQEFLRTLAANISTDELLRLEDPAFIVVIGCGRPDLIEMYQRETNCPFPIYAEPSRQLYDELGMTKTLDLGAKPEYMYQSMAAGTARSIMQAVRSGTKVLSGGSWSQVGGEFLIEHGEVTWCHRMRTTRDHIEVVKAREILGLPKQMQRQHTDVDRKKTNRRSLFAIPRRNTAGMVVPLPTTKDEDPDASHGTDDAHEMNGTAGTNRTTAGGKE